ncbi:MAG: hypothetical protein IKJ87_04750 [Ruminococcus sp.]|nr:hypothetical protein [Ruminococcus sp.]
MNDKLFRRILSGITITGCISSIILLIYTICLYDKCSIISFIANGR